MKNNLQELYRWAQKILKFTLEENDEKVERNLQKSKNQTLRNLIYSFDNNALKINSSKQLFNNLMMFFKSNNQRVFFK